MKPPKIESYCFGEIIISGERHTSDVIIFPNRVKGRHLQYNRLCQKQKVIALHLTC